MSRLGKLEKGIEQKPLRYLPKKLLVPALAYVALLGAGCGVSERTKNVREEARRAKTEQTLKNIFNPAMAKAGKKAARFARKHPDAGFWYEINPGKQELSLESNDNKHSVFVTMRDGANRTFAPGDVESIRIENTHSTQRKISIKDEFTKTVRIDPYSNPDAPCGKGIEGSSRYVHDSSDDRYDFLSFTTANRCNANQVGLKANNSIRPNEAAQDIVRDMGIELQNALREINE